MKGRRRRGLKSSWNWAMTGTMELVDESPSADKAIVGPLLPAPRVDWLLENGRGRDHLTVTSILLWLDFYFYNPTGTVLAAEPVNFWVIKERWDSETTPSAYAPYGSPDVPANVNSWTAPDNLEELDGLDPYLWTHHISQLVPGTSIGDGSPSYGPQNASGNVANGGLVVPHVSIRAAWQPDVVIRSKRRMMKGDQLNIGFTLNDGDVTSGHGLVYNLAYRARILTT